MAPPQRPGSGWLQNADGNNKNQPTLAPTPDQSEVTRTAPLPEELIARNEGVSKEEEEARRVERAKKAAEESKKREREEEEMCAICCDKLPDLERGVLSCGHLFCFACIHQWTKNSSICPGCRVPIRRITKTVSPADEAKGETGKPRGMKKKKTRKQLKRARHRDSRTKNPAASFVTKTVRVRPKSLKMTPAQQRAAPHPQAPGGWMYVQEQQQRLREQQQQPQQQQPQARVIQPTLASGAVSESMSQADAPQEVEAVVRDQATAAR